MKSMQWKATFVVAMGLLCPAALPLAGQTCSTEITGSDGQVLPPTYVGHVQNSEPSFGPIQLVVDPESKPIGGDGLVTGKIESGLGAALSQIRGACPRTGFANMPNFAAALGVVGSVTPGFEEQVTTLRLNYRRGDQPWRGDRHGDKTIAEWTRLENSDTNVISLAGKCPQNLSGFPDVCIGPNGSKDIDWSKPAAINILTHEILHALGLDHDKESGDCAGRNGLMRANPSANQTMEQEYCAMVNFKICDPTVAGANCPRDPRLPRQAGNDPFNRLAEFCEELPELCPDDYVPGEPWWVASDGGSTDGLVCTFVTAGGETWVDCRFELTRPNEPTVIPGTFQGPTVMVRAPSAGTTATGSLLVVGAAVRDSVGVQQVAAWVDDAPAGLVLQAAPDAAACAGRTDPRCPLVGFQGSLDIRGLTNGTHKLTLVASENRPSQPVPGIQEVLFQVDNTTCTLRPATAVTSPLAGQVVAGTKLVRSSASDNVGVTKVELLVDGVLKLTDATPPYEFNWNTTSVPDGLHSLETRAFDGCGNRTRSAPVTVEVRNAVAARPALRVLQSWDGAPVPKGTQFAFPTVPAGQPDSKRFTLVNEGTAPLNLGNLTSLVSGTCFTQVTTATELPVSPVLPGQATYFRVRFQCDTAGTATGSVSIASDDPDDNPYSFGLAGTALGNETPALVVSQAWDGVPIALGSTQAYPSTPVGVAVGRRYAITNTGTASLILDNPTSLVSGACFSQVLTSAPDLPVSPVEPGQTTYFRVRLLCPTAGVQTGQVSILTNDTDDRPFVVELTGTVSP